MGPITPRARARTVPGSLPDVRGSVGPSDLVAVRLTPGPEWTRIVADVWEAGAALFPVDHRLPETEAAALLTLARPTVVLDADEWERLEEGVPAGDGVAVVVGTPGTAGGGRGPG